MIINEDSNEDDFILSTEEFYNNENFNNIWEFNDEDSINYDDDLTNNNSTAVEENVKVNFEKYRQRVILNANKNIKKNVLHSGNKVLMKLDFDNNTKTRKDAFESIFDHDEYIVIDVYSNDLVKIKNSNTGKVKIIHKTRLKKID